MSPYAELIGDPVAHSRSPAIHGFWLDALALPGRYRATRISPISLPGYFAIRRGDPDWRGCNLTAPLKQQVLPLLERLLPEAQAIGAVNCVVPQEDGLAGYNTDIDGIAQALREAPLRGRRAAIIGGGGGARAAIHYLAQAGAKDVTVLVRDPGKAAGLAQEDAAMPVLVRPLDETSGAIADAAAVINASPLGMAHAGPMPEPLLAALSKLASNATAFDMVYEPLDTPFLRAARSAGAHSVDGLSMLIGQARRAFSLFFGAEPPADKDGELRRFLLG